MAEELQSQAMEIKQRFGDERAKILRASFDSALEAANVAAERVANTLSNNVNGDAKQSVFMAEAQAAASAIRDEATVRCQRQRHGVERSVRQADRDRV